MGSMDHQQQADEDLYQKVSRRAALTIKQGNKKEKNVCRAFLSVMLALTKMMDKNYLAMAHMLDELMDVEHFEGLDG